MRPPLSRTLALNVATGRRRQALKAQRMRRQTAKAGRPNVSTAKMARHAHDHKLLVALKRLGPNS